MRALSHAHACASSVALSWRKSDVRARKAKRVSAVAEPTGSLETFSGAWYGPDMLQKSSEWTLILSDEDIAEIDDALATCKSRGLTDIVELGPDNFKLPKLGEKIVAMGEELLNGRGFALMRGFPVHHFTRWEACAAFHAMGRYMGASVPQNKLGHIVGHVKDLGGDPNDPLTRLYTTSAAQPYHTDSADIVGLLCLSQATEGGHSQVTSSVAIWNELVKRHPSSARVLEREFEVSRKGEIPPGKQATYKIPIFHRYKGRLCAIYDRSFIHSALTMDGVAPLTAEQVKALDDLDALACSDDLRLDMTLEPGDIQWLHNHTTLHARSAFRNEGGNPRHLVRLWVSPPKDTAMELPPVFAERFGTVIPERGGIRVEGQVLSCPLDTE